jgi:phage repressor protein C with HTH and peptisase S24 domain
MTGKPDRLRQAREEAGFKSASEAAARFGWKAPTYLSHENGTRSYDDEMALVYSRAFRVSPEWLLYGRAAGETAGLDSPPGFRLVDVFDIEASAGAGSVVTVEEPLYELAFREDWVRSITSARGDDLLVIRAKGDSMLPTLTDGDTLLVDRTKRNINYDGLFILRYDDVLRVKRIDFNPATRMYRVKSDNPAYDAFDVSAQDLDVIGRVIWIGRKV